MEGEREGRRKGSKKGEGKLRKEVSEGREGVKEGSE
jgi:hypothetical protein